MTMRVIRKSFGHLLVGGEEGNFSTEEQHWCVSY